MFHRQIAASTRNGDASQTLSVAAHPQAPTAPKNMKSTHDANHRIGCMLESIFRNIFPMSSIPLLDDLLKTAYQQGCAVLWTPEHGYRLVKWPDTTPVSRDA